MEIGCGNDVLSSEICVTRISDSERVSYSPWILTVIPDYCTYNNFDVAPSTCKSYHADIGKYNHHRNQCTPFPWLEGFESLLTNPKEWNMTRKFFTHLWLPGEYHYDWHVDATWLVSLLNIKKLHTLENTWQTKLPGQDMRGHWFRLWLVNDLLISLLLKAWGNDITCYNWSITYVLTEFHQTNKIYFWFVLYLPAPTFLEFDQL